MVSCFAIHHAGGSTSAQAPITANAYVAGGLLAVLIAGAGNRSVLRAVSNQLAKPVFSVTQPTAILVNVAGGFVYQPPGPLTKQVTLTRGDIALAAADVATLGTASRLSTPIRLARGVGEADCFAPKNFPLSYTLLFVPHFTVRRRCGG